MLRLHMCGTARMTMIWIYLSQTFQMFHGDRSGVEAIPRFTVMGLGMIGMSSDISHQEDVCVVGKGSSV
jgi:hypothetical protein